MADRFPKDRFDSIPPNIDRVGAHRGPRARGRGLIVFLLALALTVVLVLIGVAWLFSSNSGLAPSTSSSGTPTPTASPTPTVTPTVNPNLTVNVLNGTKTGGLAATAGTELTTAGWKVGSVANASTSDIAATTIYYSVAANKDAALGVQKTIPNATISLNQAFANTGADITVVLGSNFKPAS